MTTYAYPSDRRGRWAGSFSLMDPGVTCPACQQAFKIRRGFVGHMFTEHWWQREEARRWWNGRSSRH